MNDVKLRLDYFLSLGMKLVEGDLILVNGDLLSVLDCTVDSLNLQEAGDDSVFFESFAPRINAGVQPVGDDVPVELIWNGEYTEYLLAGMTAWGGERNIKAWKPDLEGLIKMQIDHDKQRSPAKATPLRTKTEYVKCNFTHAWTAVKAFEEGGVFYADFNGGYEIVNKAKTAASWYESLYRKVENEITWKEVLVDQWGQWDDGAYENTTVSYMVEQSHEHFISMCHLVASMTVKPK